MRPNQASFDNVKSGDKLILVDNSETRDCDFYVNFDIGALFEVLAKDPIEPIISVKEMFGVFNKYNLSYIERFDIYNSEVDFKTCSTCSHFAPYYSKNVIKQENQFLI